MFDQLKALSGQPEELFEALARELGAAGKFHELFDARLTQGRQRLGLPLERSTNLDDLNEPARSSLEESYMDACREVGQLLLDAGRFREAWMYLRPVGEKPLIHDALERVIPQDETIEELIQVALYEGVAAERGLAWMLGHYGTCNSITTFEGMAGNLSVEDQRACAAVMVRHLHQEVLGNVRGHIEQQEGRPPPAASLAELVAERPWLFENDNYHVDTSHLAAVVRFARLLEEPSAVRLALELTEYGRRLGEQLRYPGEPPFEDTYPSHGLLFSATLGEQVDEAVEYFNRSADASTEEHGTAPLETLLILLQRVNRHPEALAALAKHGNQAGSLSPYAPTPLALARQCGDWDLYFKIMQDRDDAVGYVMGMLECKGVAVG